MQYYLHVPFLIFLVASVLNGQGLREINKDLSQDPTVAVTRPINALNKLFVEAGFNISSFQNIDSEQKTGYTFGLTYNAKICHSFVISISGLLSRQSSLLTKRKTTGTDGTYVYRVLFDHKVSILFLELPVTFNYKIWNKKYTSLYIGLGAGFSISVGDYSKRFNFKNTGVIVGDYILVDEYYIEDSVFDNSGSNITAGIYLIHGNFQFKFLYINKKYNLKRIDKTHSFLFNFGYQLK